MRRELHSVKESLHRTKGWLDGLSYALLAEEWIVGPDGQAGLRAVDQQVAEAPVFGHASAQDR